MRVAGFEWDRGNRDKCRRHGVSIREVESVFAEPVAVVPDPAHSIAEERFKAIGVTAEGRHVLILFTLRRRAGDTFIRPISARFMHRREVDSYEKAAARSEKR